MISGGKLSTSDDQFQVAVFPCQVMYITQGTNTDFSHRCSRNTDNASGIGRRILYAPTDVKCVRNASAGGFGIIYYHSVRPVLLADGTIGNFTLVLMHDNNSTRWTQGKIFLQGEAIYEEGDADPSEQTTGIHVHMEVAKGHVFERVRTCTNGAMHIKNETYLDNIFYKNLTIIERENPPNNNMKGDHVYNWKEYHGGIVPPKPPINNENTILHAMISKAFPFGL